jgi:hypothetical protein
MTFSTFPGPALLFGPYPCRSQGKMPRLEKTENIVLVLKLFRSNLTEQVDKEDRHIFSLLHQTGF